jgi:hypothetical protein
MTTINVLLRSGRLARGLIGDALASSYRLLVRADGSYDSYGVYERK